MSQRSDNKELKKVAHSFRKKDAMQLITGQGVYTQDLAPKDCLCVKLLRSPYANAIIEEIDASAAMKVPGMEAVFTWHDCDQNGKRFTEAGQTYPEPSPHDRLILDRHMRHVGDVAAILAGKDEKTVDKAMKLVKIKWNVLEPLLDFRNALDNEILVHPEDNWESLANVGADNKRNLCARDEASHGDVDKVLSECEVVIDETYHTKACHQGYMEPFCTYCTKDVYGRLTIVSSTQIVFHVRRNVANALNIPKSMIRVIKPRIGGGFGAKQTSVSEVYPAFVTWKTGKPSMIVYTRKECLIAGSQRHEMEMHVRLGATKEGRIRAIELHTLSNTGAYGEHGPTTVGLSGHKSIPLYRTEAFRFTADVVYTNHQSFGAYRGYGAPQGIFAVETAVNEMCHKLDLDPIKVRLMNMAHEGDILHAYYGQLNTSSALDRCLMRVRDMSGWDEKYPAKTVKVTDENGVEKIVVRSMGVSLAMQGSAISFVDVGSATIKLEEGGYYSLLLGAADMGTGCDTILSQIAAEVLECPLDKVIAVGADTDISPYDSGSYASSTTYLTGKAVQSAATELRSRMINAGAEMLGCSADETDFDGEYVYKVDGAPEERISLFDIGARSTVNTNTAFNVTVSHSSEISPPPYMAGIAELETDLETGESRVLHYYAAVDCGTPISPALAKVQTEGGILQGIGMSLYEDLNYDDKGRLAENSFMQYKIPARPDIGDIQVEFESSYEGSGPFGAKSIGEVVIDTPPAAIDEAVYNATGHRFRELPITSEQIAGTLNGNF